MSTKRHYLIFVEGAHDTSLIGHIIKHNKWGVHVKNRNDVSKVWNSTIPERFPFNGDVLDRITPVPDFYEGDNLSVAIKTSGGDSKMAGIVADTLAFMEIKVHDALDGVLVVLDADAKSASDKIRHFLDELNSNPSVEVNKGKISVLKPKSPVKFNLSCYCFPDNVGPGTIEDILIECGKIQYPEWIKLSEAYVDEAVKAGYKEADITKVSNRKKAIVGCVTNIMKPAKAIQTSISDNKWITGATISSVKNLIALEDALKNFLEMK